MTGISNSKLFNSIASGSTVKSGVDLSKVPNELRPYIEEQMKMNQEQQLVTYITNLMKSRHDSAMAILNNMK